MCAWQSLGIIIDEKLRTFSDKNYYNVVAWKFGVLLLYVLEQT